MPFQTQQLKQTAEAREVTVETRSGGRVYRTVIWVASDDDTMYIRSVRGDAGRWYQRALSEPEIALIVGDVRVVFAAAPATDTEAVEHASDGFRRKYPKGRSLDSMLVPAVLHTTLRLEPV